MYDLLILIVALLVVGSLWVETTTTLFFFYEATNGGHRQRLRDQGLSMARIIYQIVFLGVLSQLAVAVCTLFMPLTTWLWSPRRAKPNAAGPPPVLLIHGLYGNSSNWTLFRRRLRRCGYPHVYAITFNSFRGDFFAIMRSLDAHIERLRQAHGQPVFAVGHSLGGLLLRGYVGSELCRTPHGQSKLGGVLTLGAPMAGSKLAALAMGSLGESLLYEGALWRELTTREADLPAPPCPCLALHTSVDNFVLPHESLTRTPAGWEDESAAPVCHVAMLFSKTIPRRAARFFFECAQ